MAKKLKDLEKKMDAKLTDRVYSNWLFGLGAAQLTGSFYTPTEDGRAIMLLAGSIFIVVAGIYWQSAKD